MSRVTVMHLHNGPVHAVPAGDDRCPCGRGDTFGNCCGRYLGGAEIAPTAEALMRSRYVAYVVGDADYLRATWHSSTRPRELLLESATDWRGLEVVATSGGGLFDTEGIVEFKARYRDGENRHTLHERSRFLREEGQWRYLDGVMS